MQKKIVTPISQNGVTYRPGSEDALQEMATPAQLKGWRDRDWIEGDWDGLDPTEESGSHLEEELVAVLSPYAGERGHAEGTVQVAKRIIGERDEARGRVQVLEVQNEAAQKASDAGYEALNSAMIKLQKTEQERDEAKNGARLADEITQVLLPYVGERGHEGGAVDCIQRIIAERDEAQGKVLELQATTPTAEGATPQSTPAESDADGGILVGQPGTEPKARPTDGLSERTVGILNEKFGGGLALDTVSDEDLAAAGIAAGQIKIIRAHQGQQ